VGRWQRPTLAVVLDLLRVVVPLGLSAAVSPVMLSEQVVIVGGQRGRRTGGLFALGTVLVLLLVVVAVVLVGRSVRLPQAPDLDATADIVLGGVLLGSALVLARVRRRPSHRDQPKARRSLSPSSALGFGVFSMATNFTTLTLVVVAAKDVTATDPTAVTAAVALAVLVALAAMPAWAPVLLAFLPGRSTMALAALSDQVSRHGRQLAVLVLLVVGAFLVVRGVLRLTGS
jgi:hypothetical protein